MTVSELHEAIVDTSREVDESITAMRKAAIEYADAENLYRLARATSFLAATGTVSARQATVDLATSVERHRAHVADGLQKAAVEAARSRRAQLSALQTLANAHRAEAEFVRTVPDPWREPADAERFEGR